MPWYYVTSCQVEATCENAELEASAVAHSEVRHWYTGSSVGHEAVNRSLQKQVEELRAKADLV